VDVLRARQTSTEPLATFPDGSELTELTRSLGAGSYWLICEASRTMRSVSLDGIDPAPLLVWPRGRCAEAAEPVGNARCLLWDPFALEFHGGGAAEIATRWVREGPARELNVPMLVLCASDGRTELRIERHRPRGATTMLRAGASGALRLRIHSELGIPVRWATVRIRAPWLSERERIALRPDEDGMVQQLLPTGEYELDVAAAYHHTYSTSTHVASTPASPAPTEIVLELR